jgi:hypothetical protein
MIANIRVPGPAPSVGKGNSDEDCKSHALYELTTTQF